MSTLRWVLSLAVAIVAFAPAAGWTGSLTDLAGREIAWDKPAQRIIAIGPSTLRLLAYVGATAPLVGVEAIEQRDISGRPYAFGHQEHFQALPVIGQGGTGRIVDREAILRLRPDIVIANAMEAADADRLSREVRAPVMLVSFGEDGIYDEAAVLRSIELVGRVTGRDKRAAELVAFMGGLRSDLARRTANLPDRVAVYVGAIAYKGMHGIASTQAHFLPLTLINTPAYADSLSPNPRQLFVDREQVLLWNPVYLFLDAAGLPRVTDEAAQTPGFFQRLQALTNGRSFSTFPFNWYGPNLEIAFANAYFIGSILYPEQFKDIDPHAQLAAIFEGFLGPIDVQPLYDAYPGFRQIRFKNGALELEPDED